MTADQYNRSTPPASEQTSQRPPALEMTIPEDCDGLRFDQTLSRLFPEHSRAKLQAWLEAGQIWLDGETGCKANKRVKPGQLIKLQAQEVSDAMADHQAEEAELTVRYEDEHVAVISKPIGWVVHPGAGNLTGTVMNALLHRWPESQRLDRAGIVHRLDKDTSGLMIVAKTMTAQQALIEQLQAREVSRIYLAVAWGHLHQTQIIDAPIGRDPHHRTRMAVTAQGKPAVTHFLPLCHGTVHTPTATLPVTLLACKLETGRTHQIRVHARHAGWPLLGDATYTPRTWQNRMQHQPFQRQALHAWQLAWDKVDTREASVDESANTPAYTGERITIIDDLPEDFVKGIIECGIQRNEAAWLKTTNQVFRGHVN